MPRRSSPAGPRALLSHRTAAQLWNLPARAAPLIEVTVVARHRKSPPGIGTHSIASLPPQEARRCHGLPITSPSLTLLDLAGVSGRDALERVLNEARVRRLVTDAQLHASLAAHPNRSGAKTLRALLAAEHGPRITRSEAERRALALMRRHGLEPDASDHPIGPYRLDFWFEASTGNDLTAGSERAMRDLAAALELRRAEAA